MKDQFNLLEHELRDIYFAEKKLMPELSKLAKESENKELSDVFLAHQMQAKNHLIRLEEAFALIEKKVGGQTCHGILGLIKEKKEFIKEKPSSEILQQFNVGFAKKIARYKISAYESIVVIANDLGLDDVILVLSETLREEEIALNYMRNFEDEN